MKGKLTAAILLMALGASAGEARPVTSQSLAGTYGLGEYGTLAGYVWTVSALTGQKDRFRRRAYNEAEAGLL